MDTSGRETMREETVSNLYPASFDLKAAKERGLIENSIGEERYQRLEETYLRLLNEYLEVNVRLSQYQKLLDENEYTFYPVKENVFCQFRSYGRDNLYLRNNAYIERLSGEQLELLGKAAENGSVTENPELMKLIDETWREVITVRLEPNDDSIRLINYEMDAVNEFQAFNDSLTWILGYCTEYDAEGNILDDHAEAGKYKTAEAVCAQAEAEISQALNCHVKIFIIVGDHDA